MKKVVSVALLLCMLASSAAVYADTSILLVNDRGSFYSDTDWGKMPEKAYVTQALGERRTYQSEYVFEKAENKYASIKTDEKNIQDPVLVYYDENGKLIGTEKIKSSDEKVLIKDEVKKVKGFAWNGGKIVAYGNSESKMPKEPIRVFLIGDSTACNWPTDYYPEEGYGKFLRDYFNTSLVKFYNNSVSGASTTSFLDDKKARGYWADTLSLIRPGDYVIIDLGANDRTQTTDESGSFSPEKYKANLKKMYEDVKALGGIVIFTAVSVGSSSANASNTKIYLEESRQAVADYKKEVAKELGCEFITCQQEVCDFYNAEIKRLGSIDKVRGLYFRVRTYLMDKNGPFKLEYEDTIIPGNFEETKEYDYTHTTVFGADIVAQKFYEALMGSNSDLKLYTK